MVEADHMTPDEVIEWLEEEARVAVQDARHQFLVKNDEGFSSCTPCDFDYHSLRNWRRGGR